MKRSLIAAVLTAPLAALAHHGWSEYDSSKTLKLTERSSSPATSIRTAISASRRRARPGT